MRGIGALPMFQSTPPCGGRPGRRSARFCAGPKFQSTPPCGGRLCRQTQAPALICVSIHAPVWGATQTATGPADFGFVSIHAPVWGATRGNRKVWRASCFNPRPRVGGDNGVLPAFGDKRMFQSTPPCGGRRASVALIAQIVMFQSTPPCGGRRQYGFGGAGRAGVSIHAPVWGATSLPPRDGRDDMVSIHAPVWGATSVMFSPLRTWPSFNPRPRVGGDQCAP